MIELEGIDHGGLRAIIRSLEGERDLLDNELAMVRPVVEAAEIYVDENDPPLILHAYEDLEAAVIELRTKRADQAEPITIERAPVAVATTTTTLDNTFASPQVAQAMLRLGDFDLSEKVP